MSAGRWRKLFGCILAASLALVSTVALALELPMKQSTRHALTVTVIPVDITREANTWEFLVAFQSHLPRHLERLPDAVVLGGRHGTERAIIEWAGAAAASSNRQGTARFRPIAPLPKAIELRIKLSSEPAPRVFRWELEER